MFTLYYIRQDPHGTRRTREHKLEKRNKPLLALTNTNCRQETNLSLPSDAKSKHAQSCAEQMVWHALELGVMPDHIGGPGKHP